MSERELNGASIGPSPLDGDVDFNGVLNGLAPEQNGGGAAALNASIQPEMEEEATGDIKCGDTVEVVYIKEKNGEIWGTQLYEAKVKDSRIIDGTEEFLIHYKGWNKSYDHWVGRYLILRNLTSFPSGPLQNEGQESGNESGVGGSSGSGMAPSGSRASVQAPSNGGPSLMPRMRSPSAPPSPSMGDGASSEQAGEAEQGSGVSPPPDHENSKSPRPVQVEKRPPTVEHSQPEPKKKRTESPPEAPVHDDLVEQEMEVMFREPGEAEEPARGTQGPSSSTEEKRAESAPEPPVYDDLEQQMEVMHREPGEAEEPATGNQGDFLDGFSK